jgi:hypothetical protein
MGRLGEDRPPMREALTDALRRAFEPMSTMELAAELVAAGLLSHPRNPIAYQQLRALETQGTCERVHGVRDDPNVYWRYTGPEPHSPAPVDLDALAAAVELDTPPEIHGTSAGLRRHLRAGEPLCALCLDYHQELVDAGMAAPLPPGATEHDASASPPPPQ